MRTRAAEGNRNIDKNFTYLVERTKQENFVYLVSSAFIVTELEKMGVCDLKSIEETVMFAYTSIGLPRNSPYKRHLSPV